MFFPLIFPAALSHVMLLLPYPLLAARMADAASTRNIGRETGRQLETAVWPTTPRDEEKGKRETR